jgi:hypothetical protein
VSKGGGREAAGGISCVSTRKIRLFASPHLREQPAHDEKTVLSDQFEIMKWEYLLTTFNTKREWVVDELNRLGEEEWEAVAIMDDGHALVKWSKRDQSQLGPKRQRAGF